MNNINSILRQNNLIPTKYTIKNSVKIVSTNQGKLVFKKKNSNNNTDYLKSRGFDYLIDNIIENDEYNIYPYIEENNVPLEQKALDLITLVALLHNKTSFYKEVDLDYYKEIYEELNQKVDYLFNYYNDIITIIEQETYMKPSNYLLIRNISKLYAVFDYLKQEIEAWYKLVEDKRKIRLVTIHNNLSLDHIISSTNNYLINFDHSKIDIPIYDIYYLYKNSFIIGNFKEILTIYEKKFPLSEDERKLLFIFVSIPEKLEFISLPEIDACKNIRMFLDYIFKTEELITPYYEQNDTKQQT